MLNLIYRNHELSFQGLLFDCVSNYDSSKLKFNTREEYLDWVKQWKEDMKIVTLLHTRHRREYKRDVCKRPEKIDMHQKRLDVLPVPTEEQKTRYDILMTQFLADYGLKHWFNSSYYLVWYMLILRKAAKNKATTKRSERLQQVSATV